MKIERYHITVYRSMLQRCNDKDGKNFANYGGRGIKVCNRWANSVENFALDIGERPSDKHQLDRIDNDLGYSPENCHWATKSWQMVNRRIPRNNTSGVVGVSYSERLGKWWVQIKRNKIRLYLGCFDSLEDAIMVRKAAEKAYNPVS